ncbi:MAG: LLM class flavin-dependent oxidoreductase [Acidimicrobiia bacterium]|nr:LLM class flavin-dependent oxidoreductase [Acidimicrobiia bacterium]
MQLGICVRDCPTDEVERLSRFAEDNAFSHLFLPEATQLQADGRLSGRSPWVSLAASFGATTSLRAGVGVAALPFWSLPHPAATAATLHELSGGRFVLGVGASHREATTKLGASFPNSPLGYTRAALRQLAERPTVNGWGFPVLVGALGPKMVALGCREADGVVLNWLTPEHAAASVAAARAAAQDAGRSPLVVLYVRLARPEALLADAVAYDQMRNYRQHFLGQGLAAPEAVAAGTCLRWDDPGRAREQLSRYAEAGVDVVCLYPHGLDAAEREKALAALA